MPGGSRPAPRSEDLADLANGACLGSRRDVQRASARCGAVLRRTWPPTTPGSWWLANKARYEDEVRRPLELLLEDLAAEFGEAKLFRPNRDTRFSKDKSPYKTNIGGRRSTEGDGGRRSTSRSPSRGCTSVAAATTSPATSWPATAPRSRRSHRRGSWRPIAADLRAAKADVTGRTLAEDGAARVRRRPPPDRPAPPGRPHRHLGPPAPAPGSTPSRRPTRSPTAGGASARSTTGCRPTSARRRSPTADDDPATASDVPPGRPRRTSTLGEGSTVRSARGKVADGLAGVDAERQQGQGGRGDAVVDVALDVLAALAPAGPTR